MKIVVGTLIALSIAVASFFVGVFYTNHDLPDCQEDEYLYPTEDYTGPGDNVVSDYHCVNFDD